MWVRMRRPAERYQQAAKQHGVGQRVGCGGELAAIGVDRRQRLPERIAGGDMELWRDRLEQPGVGEPAEGPLGRAGAQNLVVLLEQTGWRALRDLMAVDADCIEDGMLDREVEPRRERNP